MCLLSSAEKYHLVIWRAIRDSSDIIVFFTFLVGNGSRLSPPCLYSTACNSTRSRKGRAHFARFLAPTLESVLLEIEAPPGHRNDRPVPVPLPAAGLCPLRYRRYPARPANGTSAFASPVPRPHRSSVFFDYSREPPFSHNDPKACRPDRRTGRRSRPSLLPWPHPEISLDIPRPIKPFPDKLGPPLSAQ